MEQKRIKLKPFVINVNPNGFPSGLTLKRNLTTRETMYILQKIFGFANEDYRDWFEYKEELEGYIDECKTALTDFIKGECDYPYLCDATHCYDDDGVGFNFMCAFTLLRYLQKKDII